MLDLDPRDQIISFIDSRFLLGILRSERFENQSLSSYDI